MTTTFVSLYLKKQEADKMENVVVNFGACVALTMGLTELFKRTDVVNPKYLGIFSLVIGIAFGIVYLAQFDLAIGIFQGVAIGLSASGLYGNVKSINEGLKGE